MIAPTGSGRPPDISMADVITNPAKGIYKDRGSKFLAFAEPIANEEEAKTRIE